MRIYHFTEEPFTEAWSPERETLRVTLPNELCDPEVAHKLYRRYLDEWCMAEDLGFDIMVNEHHATATSSNDRSFFLICGPEQKTCHQADPLSRQRSRRRRRRSATLRIPETHP